MEIKTLQEYYQDKTTTKKYDFGKMIKKFQEVGRILTDEETKQFLINK